VYRKSRTSLLVKEKGDFPKTAGEAERKMVQTSLETRCLYFSPEERKVSEIRTEALLST